MDVIHRFNLPGITCINCINGINATLEDNPASLLSNYSIDLTTKTMIISCQEKDSAACVNFLLRELEWTGIQQITQESINKNALEKKRWWQRFYNWTTSHWVLGTIASTLGLILLAVMLFIPLSIPVLMVISVLSTVFTLAIGFPFYYQAFYKLFSSRSLTMDFLFTVSTITLIAVSIGSLFFPLLPMMFEAGLLIFGFRHLGLALEESLKYKMDFHRTFEQSLPQNVLRFENEELVLQEINSIAIDDELLIAPGELIPFNGIAISHENIWIYDTIKTGRTTPRLVKAGEQLLSGMRLAGSVPLRLRVNATKEQSLLAQLDRNLELANARKAPLEEASNRILQWFIPLVIIAAITFAVGVGLFFPPALAIQCGVTVLLSACPCILGLVVPFAVKMGMQKAAKHGVQFKSAKSLQTAGSISAVIFDLNGTLTTGNPVVSKTVFFNPAHKSLLAIVGAIEGYSDHPFAAAICAYIKTKPIPGLEVDRTTHNGVTAQIDNDAWVIGNKDMVLKQGVPALALQCKDVLKPGDSVVYIVRNQQVLGYMIISDPLRPDALQTIKALKKLRKQIFICTGADKETALGYAKLLNISAQNVKAGYVGQAMNAKETGKTALIDQLEKKGLNVAMVGDAENDALALARCFGIAIKSSSGSEITQHHAGAIIQSGTLLPVVSTLMIAKQTVRNIKQNLTFSLLYNVVAVALPLVLIVACSFALPPVVGVILMFAQMVFILANVARAKHKPLNHLKAKPEAVRKSSDSSLHFQRLNPPKPNLSKTSQCRQARPSSRQKKFDLLTAKPLAKKTNRSTNPYRRAYR